MITVSCECGWSAREPSQIQANATFDQHRRRGCPIFQTCMICTEIGPGKLRILETEQENAPQEFVCDRCWFEHPRQGNYAFDNSGAPSKAMAWGGSRRGKKS